LAPENALHHRQEHLVQQRDTCLLSGLGSGEKKAPRGTGLSEFPASGRELETAFAISLLCCQKRIIHLDKPAFIGI
jgi:hypothetical protein